MFNRLLLVSVIVTCSFSVIGCSSTNRVEDTSEKKVNVSDYIKYKTIIVQCNNENEQAMFYDILVDAYMKHDMYFKRKTDTTSTLKNIYKLGRLQIIERVQLNMMELQDTPVIIFQSQIIGFRREHPREIEYPTQLWKLHTKIIQQAKNYYVSLTI